jgi:hypothetical protein
MKRISFVFCILFLSSKFVFSLSPIDYYSNIKEGDKIRVYGIERYDARFYAFADENSCFTCIKSLKNIVAGLKFLNQKTQFILFYSTDSYFQLEKIKDELGSSFLIVHDIASAYKELYKVKNYPFIILSDYYGNVVYTGVPGSSSLFSSDELLDKIKKIPVNPKINNNFLEEITDSIIRNDRDTLCDFGLGMVSYINNCGVFLMNNHEQKKIIVVDTNGLIIKRINLKNRIKNLNTPIISSNLIRYDSIPFVNLTYDTKVILYMLNLNNDSISYSYNLNDVENFYPWYVITCFNGSLIMVGSCYKGFFKESENRNSSLLLDLKTNRIKPFGKFAQINYDYNLFRFYHSGYCVDKDFNIYEAQSLSDTIFVYDSNLKPINNIYCNFDSTYWWFDWKKYFKNINADSPVQESMKLADSITKIAETNGLLYDFASEKIYVIYQKYLQNSTGSKYVQYYLNSPKDRNANPKTKDILLPKGCKPFYIYNSILYCIEEINGVMHFKKYKIKSFL